jgi:hypothetical protein
MILRSCLRFLIAFAVIKRTIFNVSIVATHFLPSGLWQPSAHNDDVSF